MGGGNNAVYMQSTTRGGVHESSKHSVTAILVVVLVAEAENVEFQRCTACMEEGAVAQTESSLEGGGQLSHVCMCVFVWMCAVIMIAVA